MLSRLRSYLRPPVFEDSRQDYASRLLHYSLLVGILLTSGLSLAIPHINVPSPVLALRLSLGALGLFLVSFLLLHTGYVRASAILAVGSNLAAFGIGGFLHGIESPEIMGILLSLVLGGILLGSRDTIVLGIFSLFIVWGITLTSAENLSAALPYAGFYTFIFLMSTFGLALYRRGLDTALDELQEKQHALLERNAELDTLRQSMEAQVKERTRQLEEQSALMEHTLRAARQIAGIRSTEALLETAVTLIHQEFNLYHVGIYLPDATGEYVVLHAASSEGGRKLLAQGHRLRVGSEGIIGTSAAARQIRVTADTRSDPLYLSVPELPDTRSEAVLPLSVEEKLLGVLDIQSDQPNAFTETSVTILQYLADQISSALESARLYTEGQRALRRAERAYAEISSRSWREFIQRAPWAGFRTVTGEVVPLHKDMEEDIPPEVCNTIRSGQVYTEGDTAIIPIQVRGQTIASLRLRKTARSAWGEEELHLMQAASDQIAQALESARLYEESQKLAAREQLLSTSTARMRATLDLENVLQTAVRELRSALGLSEAEIRLGAPPSAEQQAPAAPEKAQ